MNEQIKSFYNKEVFSKKDCKEAWYILNKLGFQVEGGCFCNPIDRTNFKREFMRIVKENNLDE